MEALGLDLRDQAALAALTEDAVKTSEIEGLRLDVAQVRSSLARRLGLETGGMPAADRETEGVVDMLLDATRNWDQPLTAERLFGWQAALFPGARSGLRRVRIGAWRDDSAGPMQVVSGPIGKERIHFEAPEAKRLDAEMAAFLDWFSRLPPDSEGVLDAALVHLWFVTIHPFDDGNGRIARAIADMTLARAEGSRQRYYSMSAQIRRERAAYYEILERTQRATLDVTEWMLWFLGCLERSIDGAETTIGAVLRKARFWESVREEVFNDRQRRMLNRLLDGFKGKLTSSKWAKIAKCSQDTALRDLNDLVERGVLVRGDAGGRSTSYELAEHAGGRE